MHSTTEHKTAILVFSLSSKEELKRKKIKSGDKLFSALSKHTLETVRKTKLPFFHISGKEQVGNSFGKRFNNAIQSVFEKGFEQVITIGNDTPQLKPSHIQKTVKHLSKNKVVLGPSVDGGFYLMGLHKTVFDSANFESLPWQTSLVRHQLKLNLSCYEIGFELLETLYDIDDIHDLKVILKFSKQLTFQVFNLIQSLLDHNVCEYGQDFLLFPLFESQINQNRGSPILQLV